MAFRENVRRHLGDILLFLVLFLGLLVGTILAFLLPGEKASEALFYRDDALLLRIDLVHPEKSVPYEDTEKIEDPSSYGEEVILAYIIQGEMTPMTVALSAEGVAVLESGCPSQYCVGLGYTMDVRRPIVCAYNHVHVEYEGAAAEDSSSGPDIIL